MIVSPETTTELPNLSAVRRLLFDWARRLPRSDAFRYACGAQVVPDRTNVYAAPASRAENWLVEVFPLMHVWEPASSSAPTTMLSPEIDTECPNPPESGRRGRVPVTQALSALDAFR